jgi:hypothetical protein
MKEKGDGKSSLLRRRLAVERRFETVLTDLE